MQINVSGHHVDVTPALRAYVTEKLRRIERHFEHVTSANVILSLDAADHRAEATIHAARRDLHAQDAQQDMYAAIDGMIDKLDRQVRRYKDKLTDHHRNLAPTPAMDM